MCGIVGFLSLDGAAGRPDAAARSAAMASIRHRGPDACGEYADGGVWVGHLRLSILDPSPAGNQPMATADGRFVVCYNGEIYNFRELAASLSITEGLRSHSDTEILLRAFERLETAAFARLNGIFAFAIYDRARERVWLVRDRLGVKPLYFRSTARGLAFASEIKAIAALDSGASVCDLSSVHEWLYYGNALGGRTLRAGVQQILPGHYLELDLKTGRHTISQYWSLRSEADAARQIDAPIGEVVARTRELLDQAVHRQLVSDVPVGVFLSGGVDSSAISAFAVRHYSGGRLASYSVGFDEGGEDERPKARRVATLLGTDHHELSISGANVPSLVERLVHHHDLPFADAANIPLYLMAAQISGHTKVVLQGDGGDEVFGGYRRYVTLRQYPWLRALARVARHMPGGARHGWRQRVERYLHAYGAPDLGATMARLLTLDDPDLAPTSVFQPAMRARVRQSDPFARYRECQQWFSDHDITTQMSLVDLSVELPDIFLEKVDRATMASGVEVRVPFLDDELVSYVARVPASIRLRGGRKKWLLKQALEGILPPDILWGPKTGFNVPFGRWLQTALKPLFFDHFATFARRAPGVFDGAVLRHWYAEIDAGRPERSYLLWKILNFMVWSNTLGIDIPAGDA